MKKHNHGPLSVSDTMLLRAVLEQMTEEELGEVMALAELVRERKKVTDAQYPREGRRGRKESPLFV
jgi:hypothetical protein